MQDLLKKIGAKHPGYLGATNVEKALNYDVLKAKLDEEVISGMINVQSHPEFPHLKIYKYSQNAVMEKHWNEVTLIARGLILDTKAKEVVAIPFPKFFNYNEVIPTSTVMTKDFVATEKIDGSFGILYEYAGKWRIATVGSFVSEQAQWANKFLVDNINTDVLIAGTTYLLEIIYPSNRIVVPYSEEALYLLGAYNAGLELSRSELDNMAVQVGFKVPRTYDFNSLDRILNVAQSLDHTHEGFVIRFDNGVRVKVKGDEYCRIHKLISRVTPIAIWEMLLNQDNMEQIVNDLPEEMQLDFKQIVSILRTQISTLLDDINYAYNMTKDLSNKELGLALANRDPKLFSNEKFVKYKDYIFARRKDDFFEHLDTKDSKIRNSVFKAIRPAHNVLDGYIPSSAINRFSDG